MVKLQKIILQCLLTGATFPQRTSQVVSVVGATDNLSKSIQPMCAVFMIIHSRFTTEKLVTECFRLRLVCS